MTDTHPPLYGALPIGAVAAWSVAAAGFEKILFVSPRDVELSTITASSELTTLPGSNLQDPEREKVWRSSGATAYLAGTFAEPIAANRAVIGGPNFGPSAVARLRLSNDADTITTAPAVDTGLQSVWPASGKPQQSDWPSHTCLLSWTNESAYFHWRLDLHDPDGDDGYLQADRLAIARGWQPSLINIDHSLGMALDSPDQQTRTAFGRTYGNTRGPAPRRWTLPFAAINEGDLQDEFAELQRRRGTAGDVFVFINPAETTRFHRYAMLARFASGAGTDGIPVYDDYGQLWRQTVTMMESL